LPFLAFAIAAGAPASGQVTLIYADRFAEATSQPQLHFQAFGNYSQGVSFTRGQTTSFAGQTSYVGTDQILADLQSTVSGPYSTDGSSVGTGYSVLDVRFAVGPDPVQYVLRGRGVIYGDGFSGRVRAAINNTIASGGSALTGASCVNGPPELMYWIFIRDTGGDPPEVAPDVNTWCGCGTLQPGNYAYFASVGSGWADNQTGLAAQLQFFPYSPAPIILDGPKSIAGCPTCVVTFVVEPSPCNGPANLTWEIEGWGWNPPSFVPLVEGPNVVGAPTDPPVICTGQGTPTISLRTGVGSSRTGHQVRARTTGPGGTTVSQAAIWNSCPADFDASGTLNVADIFAFLNAWFAASPRADFNGVNGIGVADIFDYLNAWFLRC
jgi:hypothetical protein